MAKAVTVTFTRDGKWIDHIELQVAPRYGPLMKIESEITQLTAYIRVSKSPSGKAIWLLPTEPDAFDETCLRELLNQFGYVMGWHVTVTEASKAVTSRQSVSVAQSHTKTPAPAAAPARSVASPMPQSPRVAPTTARPPVRSRGARKLREVVVDRVKDQRGLSLVVASRGSMRQEDVNAASAALAEISAQLQATRSPSGALTIEAVDRTLQRDGHVLNNALKELASRLNWAVSNGSLQAWS